MTLSRQQARWIDQVAADELGLPAIVLMENAAMNAAGAAIDLLDDGADKHPSEAIVTILCGGGNNGGDGYAMARHLLLWGVEKLNVLAMKPPEDLTDSAAMNAEALLKLGQPVLNHAAQTAQKSKALSSMLQASDLVVDALLGTGFRVATQSASPSSLREPYATAVSAVNQAADAGMAQGLGPLVLSVDIPSGMDCDSGAVAKQAIKADLTVTFADRKPGFLAERAEGYTGRVVIADIGVPADKLLSLYPMP